MSTKKALIYGRVSKRSDTRQASLESQIESCRGLASSEGYRVSDEDVFTERYSGHDTSDDRPNLVEIRHRIATGNYRAIIFHHTDRLARSAEEVVLLVREFRSFGCRTHFVLVPYDDSSPTGKLLLFFLGWASENEWSQIKERTQRGALRVKESGKWLGHGIPRYGYTWVKETRERRECEAQADVVRLIYHMCRDEGLAMSAICDRLNDAKVPTPSMGRAVGRHSGQTFRWRANVVSKILHDPTYMGMVVYGKTYGTDEKKGGYQIRRARTTEEVKRLGVPDPLTATIIDHDAWHATQAVIEARGCNGADNTRNVLRPFLFRGLATCGNCGSKMQPLAVWTHNRSRYACASAGVEQEAGIPTCELKCKRFSVRKHILEPLAWGLIEDRIISPGVIEDECARVLKDDSSILIRREIGHAKDAIKEIARRVKNLTVALETVTNATATTAIAESLNQAGSESERMEARLATLNARLQPYLDREHTAIKIAETAEKIRAMIKDGGLSFDRKREIMETYGISIIVNHDRTIEVQMVTDITSDAGQPSTLTPAR